MVQNPKNLRNIAVAAHNIEVNRIARGTANKTLLSF
jgi:hypothetical protein